MAHPRQSSKRALKTTGTKGKKLTSNKPEKKEEPNSRKKIIAIAIALVVLLAGIAVLVLFMLGSKVPPCQSFLNAAAKGERPDVPLNPIDRAACIENSCSFDLSQCSLPCPFGFAKDEETQCPGSCDCAVQGAFQGDIQFNEDELPQLMKDYGFSPPDEFEIFFGWGHDIWNNIPVGPRFKIPYTTDDDFTEDEYNLIDKTFRNLSRLTCLDYVPRNDEEDYVHLTNKGQGCQTYIGRTGRKLHVALPYGCMYESTIQHELAHTLGFKHEQSRPDRDSYVDIFWDNIKEHQKHNFNKLSGTGWIDLESEYELNSGMHYESFAFALDKSKPTIAGKGNVINRFSEAEHYLTEEDIREIKLLYKCKEQGPEKSGEWESWSEWSECTKTCGVGKRARYRHCVHQESGEKLVTGCPGRHSDWEDCGFDQCPKSDAFWQEWGPWAKCSQTCDKGTRMRSRECSESLKCKGGMHSYFDVQDCWDEICATGEKITEYTIGTWQQWANWMKCDATCGKSERKRSRICVWLEKPIRSDRCAVDKSETGVNEKGNFQYEECKTDPCPAGHVKEEKVDPWARGEWGDWQQWSACSESCGSGKKTRKRPCSTKLCFGPSETRISCEGTDCSGGQGSAGPGPAPGQDPGTVSESVWGEWSHWSDCDKTCGPGLKKRKRRCKGQYCPGEDTTTEDCEQGKCTPPDEPSNWAEWGQWSDCDKTCGSGTKRRSRVCKKTSCTGPDMETDSCVEKTCASALTNVFDSKTVNFVLNVCMYGTLYAGRFNADSSGDLLCLYPDGFVRLYLSNAYSGTLAEEISWEGPTKHCRFPHRDEVVSTFIRDFNQDGLDDLACHDMFSKEILVTYNKGGKFDPYVDWQGHREKCEFLARFENLISKDKIDLVCGDEKNPVQSIYRYKEGGGAAPSTTVSPWKNPWAPQPQTPTTPPSSTEVTVETLYLPTMCPRKSKNGDTLELWFSGTFTTGELFMELEKSASIKVVLGNHKTVIVGFHEGLLDMCEREKRKLTIPPEKAYGDKGYPPMFVGPRTLIYEVELLSID